MHIALINHYAKFGYTSIYFYTMKIASTYDYVEQLCDNFKLQFYYNRMKEIPLFISVYEGSVLAVGSVLGGWNLAGWISFLALSKIGVSGEKFNEFSTSEFVQVLPFLVDFFNKRGNDF